MTALTEKALKHLTLITIGALRVILFPAPETGWSQCSKSCGGGIKFKMVDNSGQMERKEQPCNAFPCPGETILNF